MAGEKILLSWSGGKDSAWCLRQLRQQNKYDIAGLLTTITEGFDRISMHGVRVSLLDEQATALGLPVRKVSIPQNCSNEMYEMIMADCLGECRKDEISAVAFGDLFLVDIRAYREEQMANTHLRALFPIWGEATEAMAQSFLSAGFRARVVCVDTRQLDIRFCGREYDEDFLDELPPSVDPCGENGEFHTFVYDGPCFESPVAIRSGDVVLRGSFAYCDLVRAV